MLAIRYLIVYRLLQITFHGARMITPLEVTLTESRLRLPAQDAIRDARLVHDLFANDADHHFAYTAPLASLAAAMSIRTDQEPGTYLDHRKVELLRQKDFIRKGTGSLASLLTIRAHIAQALIVPDIEDGRVAASVREPFIGYPVLEQWNNRIESVRNARRIKDLHDKGFHDEANEIAASLS